jgi:hypothetical protein
MTVLPAALCLLQLEVNSDFEEFPYVAIYAPKMPMLCIDASPDFITPAKHVID